MSEHIDFTVDYNKLDILTEFNTKDIKYPLLLSIPHCGTVFPEEFLKNINHDISVLRKNEDIHVKDLLLPAITEGGVTALCLNISRSFIDVNRAKVELDPNMFMIIPKKIYG